MTYSYRDSSGQIGSQSQRDRDGRVQQNPSYAERSGSIPSYQDTKRDCQCSASAGERVLTYRNGLVEIH